VSVHTCHARGCNRPVPPKMFMCRTHWFSLPKPMRDAIWDVYVPGQEVRKDPSPEYIETAQAAIDWLARKEAAS
jgi:hypothetical protein